MTGPEHYREAEQILERAKHEYGTSSREVVRAALLARAQVHATLALAAATAIQPHRYTLGDPEWIGWAEVASVESAARTRAGVHR